MSNPVPKKSKVGEKNYFSNITVLNYILVLKLLSLLKAKSNYVNQL